MQLPVTLAPKPSPTLAVGLVLAHGATAVGLVPTGLPFAVKLLSFLALAVSLAFSLARHVLSPPLVGLTLRADGMLEVEHRDGTREEGRVEPGTTVSRWLVVLRLALQRKTIAVTLPLDALGLEGHRRLRVWVRWKAEV